MTHVGTHKPPRISQKTWEQLPNINPKYPSNDLEQPTDHAKKKTHTKKSFFANRLML